MVDLFDIKVGGAGWHITSHLIALVALFVACFAIAGYITFRDDSVPGKALKDHDVDVEDIDANTLTLSGAATATSFNLPPPFTGTTKTDNLVPKFSSLDTTQKTEFFEPFVSRLANLTASGTLMTQNANYTATIVDGDSDTGATQTIVAGPTSSSVRGYHSTALQLTTDNKDNDGIQLQAPLHPFTVTDAKEFYMETKFKVNNADQVDLYIGLADIDTTVIGGVTDGISFRVADGSAQVSWHLEKNGTETQHVLTTLTLEDDTYVKLGLLKRANSSTVETYVNDVLSDTTLISNLPDDEAIYPTIALLTGENADAVLTIEYFYAYTK